MADAALFDTALTDIVFPLETISREQADKLFVFFQQSPLFSWKAGHNGCEGRADAVCVLLDEWKIPNAKAWVFSGWYLKRDAGQLTNYWNYHVAPLLAVNENGNIVHYVLDPSTENSLVTIEAWAAAITVFPHTYYGIRESHWYIFPGKHITRKKWHSRNKQNRKWMFECLAGINSLTKKGRAALIFNKPRLEKKIAAFEKQKKATDFSE